MAENIQFEQNDTPPIPPIYTLIERNAPVTEVVQQLYTDFYDPNRDPEKLFLAFDELRRRGIEGKATIDYLATGTDELGGLAKKVGEVTDTESSALEEILGIHRWGTIIDGSHLSQKEELQQIYKYAIEHEFTTITFKEFIDRLNQEVTLGQTSGPVQLREMVEETLLNSSHTFGMAEPSYFELNGPREILRLRNVVDPNFLLLGSLGAYSAREFTEYSHKINKSVTPHIIDIHPNSIRKLNPEHKKGDKYVVRGDVRALPYAPESMDHVYTNFLFHVMVSYGGHFIPPQEIRKDIRQVFEGAFQILKKGGSFIIAEKDYGTLKSTPDDRAAERDMKSIGLQSGFRLEKVLRYPLLSPLRPDTGKATVDANGFAHYENQCVENSSLDGNVALRFVKL